MDDLISRQAAIDALDVLCLEHRYKIPGKRETYSPYNEAWQDALDRAECAIGNLPSAQPETHEERTETHACDCISRQAAIDWLTNEWDGMVTSVFDGIKNLPSAQPEPCEDAVPRKSVEYICQKNTVSTNPYEHKYHDKFMQFMDDPEIYDFGRWQHSNGFNTALVAVKCDLDKVPSAQTQRMEMPKANGIIQRFSDYQVEWLKSHCDLELEPMLETWVVRFLRDTADCFQMETDKRGEDDEA